jgi:hypothetical protein
MKDYKEFYSFTKKSIENHDVVDRIETEFEAIYLDDIIERFESFLKGSGFHFKGHLQIVSDDENV